MTVPLKIPLTFNHSRSDVIFFHAVNIPSFQWNKGYMWQVTLFLFKQRKIEGWKQPYICGNLRWQSPNSRSKITPGKPSTSTAKPNHFGKKIMQCISSDQKGVMHQDNLNSGKQLKLFSTVKEWLVRTMHLFKSNQDVLQDEKKWLCFTTFYT